MQLSHRRLLGVAPVHPSQLPMRICPCADAVDVVKDPTHLDHCRQLTQGLTRRHDYVQAVVANLATEAGMMTSRHPVLHRSSSSSSSWHQHGSGSTLIADLEVQQVGQPSTLIDVTISNAATKQYVSTLHSDQRPGVVAASSAARKISKYADVAREQQPSMDFTPLAFESQGAMATETLTFLRRVARCAEDSEVCAARDFDMHARMAVSVALQLSNARLVAQQAQALRRRSERDDRPTRAFFTASAAAARSSAASLNEDCPLLYDADDDKEEKASASSSSSLSSSSSTSSSSSLSAHGHEAAWRQALDAEYAEHAYDDGDDFDDVADESFRPSPSSVVACSPHSAAHNRRRSRRRKRPRTDSHFSPSSPK
jgi:hypothetical protein